MLTRLLLESMAPNAETRVDTTSSLHIVYSRLRVSSRLLLHLVAKQNVLIAEEEFAIGNDGACPGGAITSFRLIELALDDEVVRVGFDEIHGAIFAAEVEVSVGIGNRSLAIPPGGPAR